MNNPILIMQNAGFGTTPPADGAKYDVGDMVRRRKLRYLKEYPDIGVVALVVPAGFPPEYALADARGEARPLLISRTRNGITYAVKFEGAEGLVLLQEYNLLPTDLPKATVTWASEAAA